MSITTGGRFTVRDLDLVVDEVDIGGACGTVNLVRPKSEDDVLDMYVEIGREDADPYWAALWPSSVALARGVAGVVMDVEGEGTERATDGDRSAGLAGLNVCDVGAGLGLAGARGGQRGASSVSFYDREPLALQCCLLSAEANGLTVAVGRAGEGGPVRGTFQTRMTTTERRAERRASRRFSTGTRCERISARSTSSWRATCCTKPTRWRRSRL